MADRQHEVGLGVRVGVEEDEGGRRAALVALHRQRLLGRPRRERRHLGVRGVSGQRVSKAVGEGGDERVEVGHGAGTHPPGHGSPLQGLGRDPV